MKRGPIGCPETLVRNYTPRCVIFQKSADLIYTLLINEVFTYNLQLMHTAFLLKKNKSFFCD
jgi:hypothetical protein